MILIQVRQEKVAIETPISTKQLELPEVAPKPK